MKTILMPDSVRTVMGRQSGQLVEPLNESEKRQHLASIDPSIREDASLHLDDISDYVRDEARQWQNEQILFLKNQIQTLLVYNKPILSLGEAAQMISVSPKRLTNLIYEERNRLGRFPDWLCDAGGKIQRHVIKDAFVDWVKKLKRRRSGKS